MFTGIIESIGAIKHIESLGDSEAGVRLQIQASTLDFSDIKIGDSIAISGACMTVVKLDAPQFYVDVSRESLSKTVGLSEPGPVNLEKAMRLSDRIGGHLVSGHIDGLGTVDTFKQVGESWHLAIRVPKDLALYFAYKGSVTVNGVSLTVNQVQDLPTGECVIQINLIPHTVEVTTLKRLEAEQAVNLEADQIARYTERMVRALQM